MLTGEMGNSFILVWARVLLEKPKVEMGFAQKVESCRAASNQYSTASEARRMVHSIFRFDYHDRFVEVWHPSLRSRYCTEGRFAPRK